MFRKEITVGLLSIAIGGIFLAGISLTENVRNAGAWTGIVAGLIALMLLWRAVKLVEKDEKNENKKRDEKLVSDITHPLQTELREIKELLKNLIDEIRQDRNERKQSNTDKPTK